MDYRIKSGNDGNGIEARPAMTASRILPPQFLR
jgi:hypothetical protein